MYTPSLKGIPTSDSDFERSSFYIYNKLNQLEIGLVGSEAATLWKVVMFLFQAKHRTTGVY
jgi:hypothetical protein